MLHYYGMLHLLVRGRNMTTVCQGWHGMAWHEDLLDTVDARLG